MAEWIGVSVNLAGDPRMPREWMGSCTCTGTLRAGGNRPSAEGLRERSSLADELRSDRGGDFSKGRVWSSFFLRVSPCMSAGDWNWKWLCRRPKPLGADSRDLWLYNVSSLIQSIYQAIESLNRTNARCIISHTYL